MITLQRFQKYASLFSILLMFFIDFMGLGLVFPMLSAMFFREDIHFLAVGTSHAARSLWFGIIATFFPLATFFSGPILGTLSDRLGRKRLMIVSVSIGIVGYLIAIVAIWHENMVLFACSRLLAGIAAGNEAVGNAAIVDISTPKNKAKHFGLVSMASGIGLMVGPFIGGKFTALNLGMFSGYAAPFAFAVLMCIINLLAIVFFLKETHKGYDGHGIISFGLSNLKKIWTVPGFFLLFFAIFLSRFGWDFYWAFTPVYWIKAYGFDSEMVGNRYALGAAVYALSAGILIRPLVARFKPEKLLWSALMLCAISMGILLVLTASWQYWLHIPLQQYLVALVFPVTATIFSNRSSDEMQGEMMGLLYSVVALAQIASPLLAGVLLGISVSAPLFIGAGSLLVAAYVFRRSWTANPKNELGDKTNNAE